MEKRTDPQAAIARAVTLANISPLPADAYRYAVTCYGSCASPKMLLLTHAEALRIIRYGICSTCGKPQLARRCAEGN